MKQLHQALEAGSGRKLEARSLGSLKNLCRKHSQNHFKQEFNRRFQNRGELWLNTSSCRP
jgi:hypothetical protein